LNESKHGLIGGGEELDCVVSYGTSMPRDPVKDDGEGGTEMDGPVEGAMEQFLCSPKTGFMQKLN